MNRRKNLQILTALGVTAVTPSWIRPMDLMLRRPIPSSNQRLPAIGLGTWKTFDVGTSSLERKPQLGVLKNLIKGSGSAVDTSPMYGNAERVIGDLSEDMEINTDLFMATKVWTTGRSEGIKQMENSLTLLRRQQIELMQIHNLVDWRTHYKTLQQWKEEGRIKYIGITHYLDNAHDEITSIINSTKIDFVQINYSITRRNIEKKLLRLAEERKVALMINQPFNGGSIFDLVRNKKIPSWAVEFDCRTWPEFFLKYILADPAVTCIIPGTSNPVHMAENLSAGVGRLPDTTQRARMINYMEA